MNNSKTGNATKFDSVRDHVLLNLTKHPHLRNNDSKLIATIWYQQLGKDQIDRMSAMDFLQTFADSKLHNPESIRRMRQKLQEQYPHLRGASYQHRKTIGVQTRKTIHHV